MTIIFTALSAVGLGLFFKRNELVNQIFYGLLILATMFLLKDQISPDESAYKMIGLVGGAIFANIVISRFVKNKIIRWVLPILTLLIIILFGPKELNFGIYNLSLAQPPVATLLIGGLLLGAILEFKDWLVRNYIFQLQTLRFGRALIGSIIGVLMIISTFFTGAYGFIFIAIGLFLYTIYHIKRIGHYIPALLALSATSYFFVHFNLEGLDLTFGKVLAGLFIGACTYLLGDVSSRIIKPILGLGLFAIGIVLVIVISTLNTVHPFYGGPESFVAAVYGYAIASFLVGNVTISSFLFPVLVLIGLTVPQNIGVIETVIEQGDNVISEISKPKTFDDYENVSWDELDGKYEINPSSIINFQLGPKGGITKGAIKNISGTVDFSGDKANFIVEMKVKDLTTYNQMQYESLMSSEYFNEPKFPTMTFVSKSIKDIPGAKELEGDFTMIGKTQKENVKIKYLGLVDGVPQFIGQSAIDRPKYGFKPSPQEGDVVDFTFQLILK